MRTYPVIVPRRSYRGSKEPLRRITAEYNKDALTLERYLNRCIEANPSPIQQYFYEFIAPEVGFTAERVREILFAVGCGHNGLTIARPKFDGAPNAAEK